MKKHILGFTIFAFIVGSFVSVWALFGYFTQTIPNVPKVESDNLPVFKSEKRKSCDMKSEKISYEVFNSYYFAEENVVISTLKLKWNGYGAPPEKVFIKTTIFTSENDTVNFENGTFLSDVFENGREVTVTIKTNPSESLRDLLKKNFYADFSVSTDIKETTKARLSTNPQQVVVVHGDRSIIAR